MRDWSEFLGRPALAPDAGLAAAAVGGRAVLITGAGGSIGSGLARAALTGRPRSLVMLDVSEGALYESYRQISALTGAGTEVVPVTGSVTDRNFLGYLFERHRPELIFHSAAYKHVPLMERNPFSAFANNSLGTYKLVKAARDWGVNRLVSVSTDKAVNPHSVMGASKRIAELAMLSHSCEATRMNVVRLCNVLGSSGSVVPVFEEQAGLGLSLTVTHADAERYFVTPAEAEVAILRAATGPVWGRVLIPDCGQPFRITELARYIALRTTTGKSSPIKFTGLRPGDKLVEELWSGDELVGSELDRGMRVVLSPCPTESELDSTMHKLETAVDRFDMSALIEAVSEIVPAFRWSGQANMARAGSGAE